MLLQSTTIFPTCSYSLRPTNIIAPALLSLRSFSSHHINQWHPTPKKKKRQFQRLCGTYEVGGGYPDEGLGMQDRNRTTQEKLDPAQIEALLKGGEQVTSVLEEMITLLEDMKMDEASEEVAVEIAAQGVLGKRVDEMESGFMMALDYMIQLADNDQDEKRKSLLEVIKDTVLSYLTKKCPPHVQVIGLLCRTPLKESRQELLRRVAAGGGVFKSKNDVKVHVPAANLNEIANQADDLLETMETRPIVPDRKLLARLVLIREESRNMMGGGILDERNDRGFKTLPESEVNFLTKLVALKPGKTVEEMIKNVMEGKDEGAEDSGSDEGDTTSRKGLSGIAGRESVTGRKALPVRPGMFLETVSKVLGGIYAGNVSGITAQHLEWNELVHELWDQRLCREHYFDGTPRCTSTCRKFKQAGEMEYLNLGDGVMTCSACSSIAIMNSEECKPLIENVRSFYESLNLMVHQDIPILFVDEKEMQRARRGKDVGKAVLGLTLLATYSPKETYYGTSIFMRNKKCSEDGLHIEVKSVEHIKLTILVLFGTPDLAMGGTLAHEMMHAWLALQGCRQWEWERRVCEGICQVMAYKWMEWFCSGTGFDSWYKTNEQAQYARKLKEYIAHEMETRKEQVYGQGFRDAMKAFETFGFETTLRYIVETGELPGNQPRPVPISGTRI